MNNWLAVFIGGGVGSMLRFGLSQGLMRWAGRPHFPWATLAANLLACAVLAWLAFKLDVNATGKEGAKALLAVGFCGGLSTFSAFSMENYALIREGWTTIAIANILVNVLGCLAVFHLIARTT
jgi:CrcB protein